jgi:[ribosomal protein S5]-alanine N-acetyltransferase
MLIPTLRTERLVLREPSSTDFETYRDFYSEPLASSFYGGPLTGPQAWRKLAYDLGHWRLRGFGMWSVVEQASSVVVGGCGIVWPEGWPRHELTWWIVPGARRNGYAEEASKAAIRWAQEALGWSEVETHMDDRNEPAKRLAEKLGGIITSREMFPDGLERNIYAMTS